MKRTIEFKVIVEPPKATHQSGLRIIKPTGISNQNLMNQYARELISCTAMSHAMALIKKVISKSPLKASFVGKYDKGDSVKAKEMFAELFQPYAPSKPLEGALRLTVKWIYPYRKSEPKKNQEFPIWCDTRPDGDNLLKMPKDVMGDLGFYKDDGQIASLCFDKMWAKDFGIYIKLKELT